MASTCIAIRAASIIIAASEHASPGLAFRRDSVKMISQDFLAQSIAASIETVKLCCSNTCKYRIHGHLH